ncbi:MAG: RibD family protein [Butyricicoccus sp.]|nr:RibD family protein [Butyricicoccus sp.]
MSPEVICHMTLSIDGKVTGDFLYQDTCAAAVEYYYEINRAYKADAFACGRITMEGSFTGGWQPDYTAYAGVNVPREDWIADREATCFAVAFDRRARLGWKTPRIADEDPGYDNAHIIEVVCEDAPDAHLAALREMGVSYLFAGEHELDIGLALRKLYEKFGIRRLLLEGGSEINGAFQCAGVIDELSLVVAPLTAAADSKPLFTDGAMEHFALREVRQTEGAVWLNYVKTAD